jgi:glutamate racemase
MLGIYDSGVGGLTILQSTLDKQPGLAIRYLADSRHFPLGQKSQTEVVRAVRAGVSYLFGQGCQLVILACNTATCLTIRDIQQNWLPENFPKRKVLGIVRPVSEEITQRLNSPGDSYRKVLLMATPATVASGFYQEELARQGLYHVLSMPLPDLAVAIEMGDKTRVTKLLDSALTTAGPALSGIDSVVLACTHYPLAEEIIRRRLVFFGAAEDLEILNQAEIVSRKLTSYLARHPDLILPAGEVSYFVNGDSEIFRSRVAELFSMQVQPISVKLALD